MVPMGMSIVCWKNKWSENNKYVVNKEIENLENVSLRGISIFDQSNCFYRVPFIIPLYKMLGSMLAIFYNESKQELYQCVIGFEIGYASVKFWIVKWFNTISRWNTSSLRLYAP